MEHLMKGLKGLGLRDEKGRPLGGDVLVMALRCKARDFRRAAKVLFIARNRLVHSRPPIPDAERDRRIKDMEAKVIQASIKDPCPDQRKRLKKEATRAMRRRSG
jgi:hypothetical protein